MGNTETYCYYNTCPMNNNGKWVVTKAALEHFGHPISKKNFYSHEHTKRLNEEDKEYVKELRKARALPKNIASSLSEKTGKKYSSQDIRNIIKSVDESDKSVEAVEKVLADIKDEGGDVQFMKDPITNCVEVLWICTSDMAEMLKNEKPRLFENDTTFGTSSQGYKLNLPVYLSKETNMWESAGLLFFTSETKEKVEIGMNFFKSCLSLCYDINKVGKFIFYCDKDWDYIGVIEAIFNAIVLLCNIHTRRYFKDKVLTGKAQFEDGKFLCGSDKEHLLNLVTQVRDAPSEPLYLEREEKLLEATKDLSIRPGQSSQYQTFHSYYQKNWKSCAFRWVKAYRKNLPTRNVNDTQAVESFFACIKRISKAHFGNRTPTLEEFIGILPKILDDRSEERKNKLNSKRIVIYHSNPLFRNAFESPSWKLNAGGMALFEEGIKMLEALKDNMALLDDDTVKEVFKGLSKDGYIGYYTTNGDKCNCSWYASTTFCRHLLFYRLQKSLPIFSTSSFQKSYLTTRFNERRNDSLGNDNVETDEDGDALCDDYNLDSRLASPGMEHLLKEQMEAKVCADTLKRMQQSQYESHFNCFKSFSKLLDEGLPSHVIDFLMNPEKFEIVEKSTLSSGALLQESCSSTSPSRLSNPVAPTLRQSLETVEKQTPYKDVPEHLKKYVNIPDCVILPSNPNGICLYQSSAAHIYGDQSMDYVLRRLCHKFIVDHWWYYKHFWSLPFEETVIPPNPDLVDSTKISLDAFKGRTQPYRIVKNNVEELFNFLLSDESLHSFASSQIDLSNLANIFGMNIAVFQYSAAGSFEPGWTWIYPDPTISVYSHMKLRLGEKSEMWLFNEHLVHYDLLVKSSSMKAIPTVSSELSIQAVPVQSSFPTGSSPSSSVQVLPSVSSDLSIQSVSPTPVSSTFVELPSLNNQPNLPELSTIELPQKTIYSPMNFNQCPRGRGRPKQGRFGPKSVLKSKRKRPDFEEESETAQPKKRGRKPGSKNKQKSNEDNPPVETKKRGRPKKATSQDDTATRILKAAEAAYDSELDIYMPGGDPDTCCLCSFRFDAPEKKDKPLTRCPQCFRLLHAPCLEKSGPCICDI